MKHFLTASFIALVLVIGVAGVVPAVVHAQQAPGSVISPQDDTSSTVPPPAVTTAAEKAKAAAEAAKIAKDYRPDDYTFNGIMAYIVQLFAWLLGVGAIILDNAVYYTVVTMGSYINNLSAIGVTWQIMRDIGNIVIIFGFLAIGISIILNTERLGYGKKMLPMLLVSAVFLNFSLFITEAVIDTGNLFATQFYTQINGGNPAGAKTVNLFSLDSLEKMPSLINREGISNRVMASLGLQTIYGEAQDPKKAEILFKNYWTIGFMSIILFMIAAFVFFSLAFILISRFVILLFLIILSPIGFAGLAVPQLKSWADKWWSKLFEQTITAPVLLLLLYIALRVITDVQFLTGFSACEVGSTGAGGCQTQIDYTGFATGGYNNFAAVILSFLVAMGLLLAVVIISKKLSAFGGDVATKFAGKLTFGATAFAGRRTVGRLSNYTARKIRSTRFGQSEAGRLIAGGLDRGAKASFDVRGIKAGGGLKALGGIDAGEAQKGGYRAREEELIKVRTDYAKSLRQSGGQKAATEAAKTEHDKNMAPLEAEEQAQLKTTKEIVNASREELKLKKQELDVARRSGNQDRIKTAEAAYNNDMNTHKELVEAEREKLDPIRNKMETEKKKLEVATASNSVAANQRKYGEALQSGPVMKILRAPYDWPTAVGSARREAADKIIGDSKKDKNQRNLDKLEEILAKSEGKVAPSSEDKKPKE